MWSQALPACCLSSHTLLKRLLNNRGCEVCFFFAITFTFFSVYFMLSTEHGVSLLLDLVLDVS